ncbi:MAG: FAD-dependent oxidoreductase [Candidatus Pacearchaeota archaeon]
MNKKNSEIFEVIVIGGGVAGLSAAIYLNRFNLKSALITELIGGAIINADVIENYPGYKEIKGDELLKILYEQSKSENIYLINERVIDINKKNDCFNVKTKKSEYYTKVIIYCTGTEWKKLNVPGEKEFLGKGVHYCALCDGNFYKNKIVAVIGSGDGAIKESLVLSEIAKKVYLIVRKDRLKGEPINIERVSKNGKVSIVFNSEVKEILGDKRVNKIILKSEKIGLHELEVDGIFIDIGRIALAELATKIGVEINKDGEIITNKKMETNIKGFFAAGDVTNNSFKQAITSAYEGCRAAMSAYEYITHNNIKFHCQ